MLGGRCNSFSVTRIVDAFEHAKSNAKEVAQVTKTLAEAKLGQIPFADLEIQFIGASGLPKMDVIGTADPYFVADIDEKITFVSAVKGNTLAPVWNETWRVKNVPVVADLHVQVMDQDDVCSDQSIGEFKTSVFEGTKEVEIQGSPARRGRGSFWLKIESTPSIDKDPSKFPYLFDGPIRFSRHYSPTVGMLTNLGPDQRPYSTWKMYLRGVPLFFGDKHQGWNRNYKAAQSIFQGPTSIVVRLGIQRGHRMLYAQNARNFFAVVDESSDVAQLLHVGKSNQPDVGQFEHRIKPAVYTYIISSEDDSFRFSETGAESFVDFASKHALHSNCAETVRYSGEFHPRPKGGWAAFSDDVQDHEVNWELVIDNNSGTYAPDKMLLPDLKKLLEYNFPQVEIYAWDREDPKLEESKQACREYALKHRGVKHHELQPHAASGEETLCHRVSLGAQQLEEAGRRIFNNWEWYLQYVMTS
ncbi:Ras GTPase-activating protein 4 [Termitomyces sp. J132]|nr:Ras GTPase-activating protein 4 [Termitomyces sp. J132]